MANLLDKVFKMAILKMLKEWNEYMEKVKKMMSKQNENVNKELQKLKRNQQEPLKKKCAESLTRQIQDRSEQWFLRKKNRWARW